MIRSGFNLKKADQHLSFILSMSTFALETIRGENGIKTLITEAGGKFTHPRKPQHLIRAACQHYGTTLNVATSHAKHILYNRHKVPILIAFNQGIPLIMIPTMSANSEQNIWIAFHAIVNFKGDGLGNTIIDLLNDKSIRVNASETTIQRQIALAYVLQLDYQYKYNHLGGHGFFRAPKDY